VGVSPAVNEAYVRRALQLGLPPLLIHSRAAMLNPSFEDGKPGPDDVRDCAKIASAPAVERLLVDNVKTYKPEELALTVNCPADGYLLVTDRWAVCWRATINGQPAEILGGNFEFRALRVKAGKNEIGFTYHPFGWPWLLLLSWGTVALIIAGSIFQKPLKAYLQKMKARRAPANCPEPKNFPAAEISPEPAEAHKA
jgi:hypothetical protein